MKSTKCALFLVTFAIFHMLVSSAPASISTGRYDILEDFRRLLSMEENGESVEDYSSTASIEVESEWWKGINGQQYIVKWNTLDNFSAFRVLHAKYAFVMFYTEWCRYSKEARNAFAGVAEKLADEASPVTVSAVDCETSREICDAYSVQSVPRFLFLTEGILVNEYKLNDTVDGFYQWVLQNVNELMRPEYTIFEEPKPTSKPDNTYPNEASPATILEKIASPTSDEKTEKLAEMLSETILEKNTSATLVETTEKLVETTPESNMEKISLPISDEPIEQLVQTTPESILDVNTEKVEETTAYPDKMLETTEAFTEVQDLSLETTSTNDLFLDSSWETTQMPLD